MKVLCIQYDNRGDIFPQLTDLTKKACRSKKWQHIFLTTIEENYPPYWIKVFLVKKYLSFYDYVIWLDSDAALINPDALLLEGDFIYCRDPAIWSSHFNAGVFIVKNSEFSKMILKEWMKGYNPLRWHKGRDNIWRCDGKWAGKDYEQGYFAYHILPKYKKKLKEVPTKILQGYTSKTIGSNTFAVHFPNRYKSNMQSCLDKLKTLTFQARSIDISPSKYTSNK